MLIVVGEPSLSRKTTQPTSSYQILTPPRANPLIQNTFGLDSGALSNLPFHPC